MNQTYLLLLLNLFISLSTSREVDKLNGLIVLNNQGPDAFFTGSVTPWANGMPVESIMAHYIPGELIVEGDKSLRSYYSYCDSLQLEFVNRNFHDHTILKCEQKPLTYSFFVDPDFLLADFFILTIESQCYTIFEENEDIKVLVNENEHAFYVELKGPEESKFPKSKFIINEY